VDLGSRFVAVEAELKSICPRNVWEINVLDACFDGEDYGLVPVDGFDVDVVVGSMLSLMSFQRVALS